MKSLQTLLMSISLVWRIYKHYWCIFLWCEESTDTIDVYFSGVKNLQTLLMSISLVWRIYKHCWCLFLWCEETTSPICSALSITWITIMHYMNASYEHAIWRLNKRLLDPLLYFENCHVNPHKSNLTMNDHVMKTYHYLMFISLVWRN